MMDQFELKEMLDYMIGRIENTKLDIPMRDWFAGLAMQGLSGAILYDHVEIIARDAYALADAMMKEREKCQK